MERILIIEDEIVIRRALSKLLRRKGYEVFEAETKPILELFKSKTKCIDASMSIDSILESLYLLFNIDTRPS